MITRNGSGDGRAAPTRAPNAPVPDPKSGASNIEKMKDPYEGRPTPPAQGTGRAH
jgi:hypothetical protein